MFKEGELIHDTGYMVDVLDRIKLLEVSKTKTRRSLPESPVFQSIVEQLQTRNRRQSLLDDVFLTRLIEDVKKNNDKLKADKITPNYIDISAIQAIEPPKGGLKQFFSNPCTPISRE